MKPYCSVCVLDLRFQSHVWEVIVMLIVLLFLVVMKISSILMVPRIVIVARCYSCSKINNSNDGINLFKACNTANLHTL